MLNDPKKARWAEGYSGPLCPSSWGDIGGGIHGVCLCLGSVQQPELECLPWGHRVTPRDIIAVRDISTLQGIVTLRDIIGTVQDISTLQGIFTLWVIIILWSIITPRDTVTIWISHPMGHCHPVGHHHPVGRCHSTWHQHPVGHHYTLQHCHPVRQASSPTGHCHHVPAPVLAASSLLLPRALPMQGHDSSLWLCLLGDRNLSFCLFCLPGDMGIS